MGQGSPEEPIWLDAGAPPIPVEHGRYSLTYNIADLKTLAYQYAQGRISHECIHKREGDVMNKMQSKQSSNSNNAEQGHEDIQSDSAADRLDHAIGDVALLAEGLYTINIALGTVGLHTDRPDEELGALRRLTEDYCEKAYKIADDLLDIHEDVFGDADPDVPDISDDELEALIGALEAA